MSDRLTTVLALPARKRDALVAEKIMGLYAVKEERGYGYGPEDTETVWRDKATHFKFNTGARNRINFSTNAAADYAVLVRVRETWEQVALERFVHWLDTLFHLHRMEAKGNGNERCIYYLPGDYSIAALAALEESWYPVPREM